MPARPLLIAGAVLLLAGCSAPGIPSTPVAPPPVVTFPTPAADPDIELDQVEPGYVGMVDRSWAIAVAEATGIPVRAVAAYAGAMFRSREVYPDCGIGWNTLAGIGLAESDHGRHDGSSIGDDYRVSPDIYGIQLTSIPDTDGGLVDGDTEFDRAVGPMQLIPQSWASWPSDGNGDGNPDPQNIADAAIASANYLCRASGGMTDEAGWQAAIAAYNTNEAYIRDVAAAAQQYFEATEDLATN